MRDSSPLSATVLNPGVVLGQGLVEEDLAQGGLDERGLTRLPAFRSFPAGVRDKAFKADLDLRVQVQLVRRRTP